MSQGRVRHCTEGFPHIIYHQKVFFRDIYPLFWNLDPDRGFETEKRNYVKIIFVLRDTGNTNW